MVGLMSNPLLTDVELDLSHNEVKIQFYESLCVTNVILTTFLMCTEKYRPKK